MSYKKKENQGFALKLLLMIALDIQQDILLVDLKGQDRITNKKLLTIIKILEM